MNEESQFIRAETVRQTPALQPASASSAAEKTITLLVPGMNCPSCPYMIEQSISLVGGVQSVDAELETRACSVTFDDAVASVEDIPGATAGIGYPSTIIKSTGAVNG